MAGSSQRIQRNRIAHTAARLPAVLVVILAAAIPATASDIELPNGFQQSRFVGGLRSPSTMTFGPNGYLYVAERVAGQIRIVTPSGTLKKQPLLTVRTPRKENGELPGGRGYKSSGLRGFAFHPRYPDQPFLYVFYMPDEPRHNRISRFRLKVGPSGTPVRADPGSERVLMQMPLAEGRSGGSHNGGAVSFGPDGMLYFTTGDGWKSGDPVQTLDTYAGKVFRLKPDGSIPQDNPFYDQARGPRRTIYALGLRNPFSMTRHPETGALYINDCAGPGKANVHRLRPGANFGYSRSAGYAKAQWDENSPGTPQKAIANATAGVEARLITGGAWYPAGGPFPERFHNTCFLALWGSNGPRPGTLRRMVSAGGRQTKPNQQWRVVDFAKHAGAEAKPDDKPRFITNTRKPAYIRVGPDGALYWLATTYRTKYGAVYRIHYTGQR